MFETISGQCSQHILKRDEHGTAEPVRRSWLQGLRKGYPTLCGGCLCRRAHPEPRAQKLPTHTLVSAGSAPTPGDVEMNDHGPDIGTGPEISLQALAILAMDQKLSKKQRHENAPYAFNSRGELYKQYYGVLDAVDDTSGVPIVSEERAKTLLEKSNWEKRLRGSTPADGKRASKKAALATGPRMGLADLAYLALNENVPRAQRHEMAPYAYSPRGILYNEYFGVVDAVDYSGMRILSKEKARTLVHNTEQERHRLLGPEYIKMHQKKVIKTTGTISPAELAELARLVMNKKIKRKQRHEMAPYAFSPKGYLYAQYLGVLDALDDSGVRILSEKKAKTLVGGKLQMERLQASNRGTGDPHNTYEDMLIME